MRPIRILGKVLKYGLAALVIAVVLGLAWLRWESQLPREQWFKERHGNLIAAEYSVDTLSAGNLSERVTVTSDSGLKISFRVIRGEGTRLQQPILLVLGGHRTGEDAVDLFGDIGDKAVVGVDYPYDGPEKVRGLGQTVRTLPAARRAILDAIPGVSLVLDWILEQEWSESRPIVIVGASLGVPFAAVAAARDKRVSAAMLIHGAADNRAWLQAQIARRMDNRFLHRPLSTLFYWLSYPPLDAGKHIAGIAPRPVLIIGARDDERTPAGQTELLYELAGDPKRLRWSDGLHIEPDRTDIITELLGMADAEMDFLLQR